MLAGVKEPESRDQHESLNTLEVSRKEMKIHIKQVDPH